MNNSLETTTPETATDSIFMAQIIKLRYVEVQYTEGHFVGNIDEEAPLLNPEIGLNDDEFITNVEMYYKFKGTLGSMQEQWIRVWIAVYEARRNEN